MNIKTIATLLGFVSFGVSMIAGYFDDKAQESFIEEKIKEHLNKE